MAYSDKVVEHYENPRNVGSFDKADESVGTGMVGAPACGDVMKLQIKVNPETGIIEDARFKTYGCGSAIASSSLVTGSPHTSLPRSTCKWWPHMRRKTSTSITCATPTITHASTSSGTALSLLWCELEACRTPLDARAARGKTYAQ